MPGQSSPRVFISYSHDSRDHEDRVLALADHLREVGVDAVVDQYNIAPPDGWPMWVDREIRKADFIALVCTETYLRRVEGREEPGRGRGVLWEAKLIYNHLNEEDTAIQRFIPILMEGGAPSCIPWPIRGYTHYRVDTRQGYEDLYRHLIGEPAHEMPSIGSSTALPMIAPRSYPASLEARPKLRPSTTLDSRNRLQILKRVRLDWIDGVLNQSLYHVARIELGLDRKAVEQPLNAIVQIPDCSPTVMPLGTTITQVFDDQAGALLILGAPGTGKTTLLLELARQLLDRAEQDGCHPIPVVFNLSSWASRRQPLARWLAAELNERSDVPKGLARRWVEAEQILPLLDGLDEVASDHRHACVDAINNFRRDHGLLPIAVCSRTADYEALGSKLRMRSAIAVQPLTRLQIHACLEQVPEQGRALRGALTEDPSFFELLETPLMLWVAILAFGESSLDCSKREESLDQRRRQLFAGYINAMFKRRSVETRYTPQQTVHCLSWLASVLSQHNQTVFHLEGLHVEWLATRAQKWCSRAGMIVAAGLVGGPIFGLSCGLILWLAVLFLKLGQLTIRSSAQSLLVLLGTTVDIGMYWALTYWLSIALCLGLFGSFLQLRPVERLRVTVAGLPARLGTAVRIGLFLGLAASLALFPVLLGVMSGAVEEPNVVLLVAMGWPKSLAVLIGDLFVAVSFGLIVALTAGLVMLLSSESMDSRRRPNQGTQRSLRTAMGVVLLFLIGGFGLGLSFKLGTGGRIGGLIQGLVLGFSGGLIVGLISGGLFSLKHFLLRLTLWMNGLAPLNYVRFLDYSVGRLFLCKVGGGYIFMHRILMEYFVSLQHPPLDRDLEKPSAEVRV